MTHSSPENASSPFDLPLTTRLRADFMHGEITIWNILIEAADEIERLRGIRAQSTPSHKQIEAVLDDFLGVDSPHYEEMRKRCAQRIIDLFALSGHCEHKSVHDGPRIAARWGTVPTQICDCGAWRTMHHTPGQWQPAFTSPESTIPKTALVASAEDIAASKTLIGVEPQEISEAVRLLTKIADLVDAEDAGEPLDDAIRYANEALAALAGNQPQRMRAALQQIKDICAGDRVPNWKDDWQTTHSRGRILDLCDAALSHTRPKLCPTEKTDGSQS